MPTTAILFVAQIFFILCPVSPILVSNPHDDLVNLIHDVNQLQGTLMKQAAELEVINRTMQWTTEEIQATKDELFAAETELRSTTSEIISVRSALKTVEEQCQNETNQLRVKLAKTESELAQTVSSLSQVQVELNSTKHSLDSMNVILGSNSVDIDVVKDQLANKTNVSNCKHIGFLMSSAFGDNGLNHSGIVFNVANSSYLIFSKPTLNTGHTFDVHTGTMTAPVTGIYLLWVNINMAKHGFSVRLVKNHSGEILGEQYSQTGQVAFSIPVHLVKGETAGAQLVGENLLYHHTPASEFGGVLIKEF